MKIISIKKLYQLSYHFEFGHDGEIFYEGILDFKKLQSEFKLGRKLGKSENEIYSVNDRLCYEATSNEYKNGKWIKFGKRTQITSKG